MKISRFIIVSRLHAGPALCGIVMQTMAGYYNYELSQYAKELYLVTFPQVLTFVLLAMFIQTVVSNKFIGHGIIIGVAVINPDLDAVSEMKVTSQNYDAEFGNSVAGLVTAQTKSGSNDFHGSAFEFRRSDRT